MMMNCLDFVEESDPFGVRLYRRIVNYIILRLVITSLCGKFGA